MRDLQVETILLVLPAFYLVGIVLLVSARQMPDPLQGGWPAVILFLIPVAVGALRTQRYLAAAWVLALGTLGVNLLLAAWARLDAAVYLLALPVGLATLLVCVPAGILLGLGCSLLLMLAPTALLPIPAPRVAPLIGLWGTIGLVWLTLRPFRTAAQWYWSSYEHHRQLLEQARDTHVQLKQTMGDLGHANEQLTRLNHLAHGLRQAAEEARRAKEEFVANVSHELRTPLNMVIGFSEMILQSPGIYGAEIPQNVLADLDVILRNAHHLAKLIDDVLDLSQIETNQIALTREPTPIQQIVAAAVSAVRPLFESKALYLHAEVSEDLVVYCDATRVRQVVLNLLSNAGRFTQQGGVTVRAWREGDTAVVSVADTGPGIARKDQERVFQPFQQGDNSAHRRFGGSGLGLSISKRFVELHEGRMWLESEEGKGSTFFFTLPIDPPAPASADARRWLNPYWQYAERTRPSMAPVPVLRPRFLVLDDQEVLTRLLARYMHGAELVPVASMQEAAQKLTELPARALLLNDAPVGATLDRLSETDLPHGTPVLVCSIPGTQDAAGGLGASAYLIKPVSRDALIAALERLGLLGGTILIVDDEPEALRLYRRILLSSGKGYRILTAADGREALDVLAAHHADAVLLDLVMPRMDGFQFLAERSRDPALKHIPVVVMSARDCSQQPVVSNALAVRQNGGLSLPRLLACIDALSHILAPPGQVGDPEQPESPVG